MWIQVGTMPGHVIGHPPIEYSAVLTASLHRFSAHGAEQEQPRTNETWLPPSSAPERGQMGGDLQHKRNLECLMCLRATPSRGLVSGENKHRWDDEQSVRARVLSSPPPHPVDSRPFSFDTPNPCVGSIASSVWHFLSAADGTTITMDDFCHWQTPNCGNIPNNLSSRYGCEVQEPIIYHRQFARPD